jgi:hypothetical protein
VAAVAGHADHVPVGELAARPARHQQQPHRQCRQRQPPRQHRRGRVAQPQQPAGRGQQQDRAVAERVDPADAVHAGALDGQEVDQPGKRRHCPEPDPCAGQPQGRPGEERVAGPPGGKVGAEGPDQ